nr:MAG TPA: hypothetical protein [Bacteriophage sp.]
MRMQYWLRMLKAQQNKSNLTKIYPRLCLL